MNKRKLWVIEIRDRAETIEVGVYYAKQWMPTTGAYLSRAEARWELDHWRQQDFRTRVVSYTPTPEGGEQG